MSSTARLTALAALVALTLLAPVAARETGHFPVDRVVPGMTATGVTVFEGTKREPFTAHIIGVLRNAIGPRRNLILARLEGGPLEKAGVIAGMSGSPVFVDGRLLGAVSYSLGQFTREPIAGITPIGEMVELAAAPSAPLVARTAQETLGEPVDEKSLVAELHARLSLSSSGERFEPVRGGTGQVADLAMNLRRIATPLTLAGLSEPAAAGLGAALGRLGLRAVSGFGGSAASEEMPAEPLQGGDAIGVNLVSGDLSIAATGTVTLVEGNRVYAFGHPLVNLGPVRMPMTRAYVHTVLPSLMDSFKISSAGPVVGTLDQDRSTAIGGTLGPAPRTIPVRVDLHNARGRQRQFAFEVTDDPTLTPTLAFFSVLSVLQSFEREVGSATYDVRGQVRIKDHGAFTFDDTFAGDAPSGSAAGYIATPLALLSRTPLAEVAVDGVDLSIRAAEQPRTLAVDRVWLDSARVRPGDTVTAHVALRPWRGTEIVRSVPVQVPANARGTLALVVADATRIAPFDSRDLRQVSSLDEVGQLLALFGTMRRNNVLYVRLLSGEPGVTIAGQALTSLPPSVMGIVEAGRPGAGATPLRQSPVGAWDVRMDGAVTGIRQLTFTVDPN